MLSLLDPAECERTIQRLRSLKSDTRPLWGRMTVAQMLAHCRVPLEVTMGRVRLKRMWLGLLIGPILKKKVLGPKPFPHNGPTAPEFRMTDALDFERERARLVDTLHAFRDGGPSGITAEPHPFFGPMTVADWERLQWKHVDHHLRQFGA